MLQPSISPPSPQSPSQGLRFGFPRVYLVAQLRARLDRLLGAGACQVGYLDRHGDFVAVAADDDFDGPEFALKVRPDPRGGVAREHVLVLQVGILYGRYHLQVQGHDFEIAFLPVLDNARLMTAARRIVHTLEGIARVR